MPSNLTAAQKRLNVARDRQRRAALGPPLSHSDEDLTRVAKTGPEFMAEVEAFVRDAAGEEGVKMLRAKAE